MPHASVFHDHVSPSCSDELTVNCVVNMFRTHASYYPSR